MSLEQQSESVAQLLAAVSAANTAAATSAWTAVPTMLQGDVAVIANVGAVTGQIVPTVEEADDGSGTNAQTVTPLDGAWTTITASNDPAIQKRCFRFTKPYYRFVGTITTGPVLIGVEAYWHPKDTAAKSITTTA